MLEKNPDSSGIIPEGMLGKAGAGIPARAAGGGSADPGPEVIPELLFLASSQKNPAGLLIPDFGEWLCPIPDFWGMAPSYPSFFGGMAPSYPDFLGNLLHPIPDFGNGSILSLSSFISDPILRKVFPGFQPCKRWEEFLGR